ncbi:putative pre-mRNA-splicing factor ATP-dependent RNA helicase DEAH9 [Senna tora]|uniref:RNA helicase n=1 Tax=Senna tora TaxID=362788 RepID=A0A834SGW7_9FABA|nr:putative pre-mRNA-splicing factor ATP-dependent RNA helicase DEAH9 [Senna tora]
MLRCWRCIKPLLNAKSRLSGILLVSPGGDSDGHSPGLLAASELRLLPQRYKLVEPSIQSKSLYDPCSSSQYPRLPSLFSTLTSKPFQPSAETTMTDSSEEAAYIEKLYEYGEQLSNAKDKAQNVKDYQGIIDAAKTSVKAKQLAAQLIPRFFKFFPDLSGPALDAHLDLVEEEELGVRVQAIRGLPLFCKDTPENIGKIVDILVQILGSEEFVERDAVHKALMSLLRQDVKASLTALFKHIGSVEELSTDDVIREKVINFVKDKVFPVKGELLKPQEEMERHITDMIKKSLEDVTGAEFRMFMDFLKSLTLFGEKAPPERMIELIGIVEGQADLDAQFNSPEDDMILNSTLIIDNFALKESYKTTPKTGKPATETHRFSGNLSIGEKKQIQWQPNININSRKNKTASTHRNQKNKNQTSFREVSDADHIDRLISCLHIALPIVVRGASSSKFLNYINKYITPVFDKLTEERKVDLLKSLAEFSPYTTPQDSRQILPSIVQLLKKYMPRKKSGEETNFTYVECLLYTFHHLAHKVPNATNSLCGYKIVTGQPSDRLGEDFSDNYKDFTERLNNIEELTRATIKKLTQGMAEHNKSMAAAKTDEAKEKIKTQKQNTTTGLRTCNNILAMTKPLHAKTPSFIGDKSINLSWKEIAKAPASSTTTAAGVKRLAATNGANNFASKKGRGGELSSVASAMSQFWKPGTEKPRLIDDEEGGVLFFSASPSFSSGYGYASMEKQRQRLPVYKYRTAILYLVETHATTIIVGETGSGKTTQIPQYLKEAGWADGGRVIACTQPRRLAVQAVSSRVAEEMGVKPGEEVGYTIRFEDLTKPDVTVVKFLTDGVLLREMMDDPLLTKYSVIMVDEAHERSISTDILLGLLKKIQRRRPDLRLIISSATIEAKSMADFFRTSKKRREPKSEESGLQTEPAILSVEGRGFNVEINYAEEPVSDYVQTAVSTVLLIHEREPVGDILVFLTGQDDIDAAIQLLTEEARTNGKNSSGLIILPLYSGLPRAEQELVFSPTPRGKRKVVVSTNIAETSLTLEGIVYVVDSGFSKQRFYNPISDIENLVVAPISKASARQRAGRAGRVRPGKCYRSVGCDFCRVCRTLSHLVFSGNGKSSDLCKSLIPLAATRLYTEEYFNNDMSDEGIPEIQRSNLVSCVIQLKALGIDNILGFDWPASPSPEAMIRALEVLYSLGVLDDDAKLTSPTGFQVAEIPLDPMISKMMIASSESGCSEEIITIAAVLSIQSIWVSGRGIQRELDEAKLRFAAAEGDHVTFLNVYKGFLQSGKSAQWCHKNHVNYQAMKKVLEVREQLKRIAQRIGIVLKSCEGDIQVVRKAVTSGFFANACRLEVFSHNGMYKTIRGSQEVYIHPSSVLFRVNPKWVLYSSLVSTDRQYMRNVITIDPSWLLEAAPQFYQLHRPNPLH